MRLGIREVIFITLMIGLLAVTYFFVFTKKSEERRQLEADTEEKRKQLAYLQQATAGIEDLGRKVEDLQKAIEFFESKLPQEEEIDHILREVSQLADANALQTRSVKTLKSERSGGFTERPIQMSLSGDFDGFYSFLLHLEKLPRLTRVTQMNLQKINDDDGAMQAQLTLSIFFEPDNGTKNVATTH